MQALVTGASGFVGSYLVRLLLERGYEVCGTFHARRPESPEFSRVHLERVDVTDREALMRILTYFRPDEVYHLAGIAVTAGREPGAYYRVNFWGTFNLLEAAHRAVPRARVLVVASAAAYGVVEVEEQPILEEQAFRPLNHYGVSKAAADLLAYTYVAQGLQVLRARPFNHTGPGQSADFVCSSLAKQVAEVASGRRGPAIEAGNLEAARDFTDVRDVVEAYWLLLQKGQAGEAYNVCSQKAYSVREIAAMLAEAAGIEITLRSRPELRRGTDIPVLLGSREKIRRDTGWEPKIPFQRTLREMLRYWQEIDKGPDIIVES